MVYAWYALYTSVQVANTLPHKDNPNVCSHLLFTAHRPNVQSFRVWGCMMDAQLYGMTPSPNKPTTSQSSVAARASGQSTESARLRQEDGVGKADGACNVLATLRSAGVRVHVHKIL